MIKRLNHKGFSLVELIVAIAMFALVSGVLMKFFVVSATGEALAETGSKMLALGNQTLENFQYADNLSTFEATVNGGSYDKTSSDDYETLTVYYDHSLNPLTDASDATYKMLVTITYPTSEVSGLGDSTTDFDVAFGSLGTIALSFDDASQMYRLSATGHTTQSVSKASAGTTLSARVTLTDASSGTVTIDNQLSQLETSSFYDEIKDTALSVTLIKVSGNTSTVLTTGNVNVTAFELEDDASKGLYTVDVQFIEIKTATVTEHFTGQRYGGLE